MTDTVASLLTPPGRTALATIGLAGIGAWDAAARHFRPRDGKPLGLVPGSSRLGTFGGDLRDEAVLVATEDDPPRVEIHVHGGEQVSSYLLDLIASDGVRVVPWPEYLAQTASPLESLLPHARTLRAASILLDQIRGAYNRAIADVRAVHPEPAALPLIDALLARAGVGAHLVTPWRVALIGPPNAGKSTLLNALAGYARCVVSPTPGTTRDAVELTLSLAGRAVTLIDTAGLRDTADPLERIGIGRTREAAAGAELCLRLIDSSAPKVLVEAPDVPTLDLVTKTDLPPAWNLDEAADAVRVSAETGDGLDALQAAIIRHLEGDELPPGAAVPVLPSQVEELRALRSSIRS